MSLIRVGFALCAGLILADCASLVRPTDSHPPLALGESVFYLQPMRTDQNQVDLMIGLGALGTLSRDLDKDGQCKTYACRANWQSALGDVG